MNKQKGIIFDLDGVICHTDSYHYLAWKKIADQLGVPFDEEKNHRLRGVSRMESLEIVLEDYPQALSQEKKFALAKEKNQYYRQYLGQMSPQDISSDVLHTLQVLKNKGIAMAIGSSSKNAGYILERTQLTHWFHAVVDGNHIQHSKPHPEVFCKAAEALQLLPSDCLVVEDAKAGVQAAHAAGMPCAAIGDAINDSHAEYKLEKLSDVLSLFTVKA